MSGGAIRVFRPALAAGVVLAAAFALVGCTGGGSEEPDEPAGAASDEAAPSEDPVDPLADCLRGTWQLDTADYLSQSTAYLQGLGVPIDTLDVEGGQQLTFADEGHLTQSTDLTWTASIMGYTLVVPSQSVGEGAWSVDDGTLSVADWSWVVDPAEAPPPSGLPAGVQAPEFPGFSLEGLVVDDIACADTITLQGAGAPLRGLFVRLD